MHIKTSISLAVALGLGLMSAASADMDKTTTENSVSVTEQTSVKTEPGIQWTELRGEVERIDLATKSLQIKEKGTNKLVQVTVDENIRVMDNSNHQLALGDLKEGKKVIIRHNDTN